MTVTDTLLSQIIKHAINKLFSINSVWVSLRFYWKLLDSEHINFILDFEAKSVGCVGLQGLA